MSLSNSIFIISILGNKIEGEEHECIDGLKKEILHLTDVQDAKDVEFTEELRKRDMIIDQMQKEQRQFSKQLEELRTMMQKNSSSIKDSGIRLSDPIINPRRVSHDVKDPKSAITDRETDFYEFYDSNIATHNFGASEITDRESNASSEKSDSLRKTSDDADSLKFETKEISFSKDDSFHLSETNAKFEEDKLEVDKADVLSDYEHNTKEITPSGYSIEEIGKL